jgi:putative ABC transport system permease protein
MLRFFQRRRWDRERKSELDAYLEIETAENIARGMRPADARDAARKKLGNPTLIREEIYRMNTIAFLESLVQDLRHAMRLLRINPGFAAVAILSLALGIGGNTAVFTVIRHVLLKPLEYRDPERLVKIARAAPDTILSENVDFATTADWRARAHSFETLSLYRNASGAIVEQGQPELLDGMRVGHDYFTTLGVTMQLGRSFLAGEDRPDRRFVVILTHGLWKRRFGGDPGILGRAVRMSDRPFTVVGVLPENFRPLSRAEGSVLPEMYIPLGYALNEPGACRGCQHLQLIGRLKPGVSPAQARAELNSIMRDIVKEHPKDYPEGASVNVTPLLTHLVARVDTAMWVLMGAVGFVLLIACANVANLVLARATGRAKEIALRAALGAGRSRLVRQLISESVLLAFAGAVVGLALAWWGTSALVKFGPIDLPRAGEIRIDGAVLGFTLIASLLTSALFGIMPSLRASRVDLTDALKDTARSTPGRSQHALRNLLVSAEIALAFVLLMGAGLLAKSFLHLMNVNPGYDPHQVLTAGMYVYGERYRKAEVELSYYNQVMEGLRATPGVESVAMVSTLPLASYDRRGFHVRHRPLANSSDAPSADAYSVTPDYFRTMKIPLKRGRFFTGEDRLGSPRVALISETCARTQFPNEDPIGRHIQLGGRFEDREWLTIVGVAGDVRQYALDRPPEMAVYIAQAQDVGFGYELVARTSLHSAEFERVLRNAISGADKTQPMLPVRPLESYLAKTLATRTFTLTLLALFGGLAVLLAAIGIYGVISYAVTIRTRELGIRVALGADRGAVLRMVLGQGMKPIAIGLIAGLIVSFAVTRSLSSLLFEVRPMDTATSFAVVLFLAGVASLAGYVPARRAASVDPMIALREE